MKCPGPSAALLLFGMFVGWFPHAQLAGGLVAAASQGAAASNGATEPETVRYCQLLKSPAAFEGKTVRITAVYLYSFENQRLLPSSCCEDRDVKTWVEFGELDRKSRKLQRRFPEGTGMVRGTFVGRIDYEDSPSPTLQGCQFKFTITAIDNLERVAKGKEIAKAAWKPPFCKQ